MLIEGLEIVNKIEIMEENTKLGILSIFFGICALACFLSAIVNADFISPGSISFVLLAATIILLIIGVVIELNNKEKPTGEYYYEVILDDTVNLKEFYQKYEVIEIKGDLYTIKEKE